MKPTLPKPEHYSYQAHRKQVVTQVILPVVLAGVLMLALIVLISLATFNDNGDVGRWAAISIIWIIIPIMLAGLISLALLIGLIYLIARLLGILPIYSGMAQDYVQRGRGHIVRGADMAAKPVFAIEEVLAYIKAFFGRM